MLNLLFLVEQGLLDIPVLYLSRAIIRRKSGYYHLLLDTTAERMRSDAPKVYSRELAKLIFAQPYCRIGHVVDAGIAQRQSASVDLEALATIGMLEKRKAGRERLFINPALLDLLTLSIVVIEVALICAVMSGSKGVPTLGRDTMFAGLMIVLNGVVSLAVFVITSRAIACRVRAPI